MEASENGKHTSNGKAPSPMDADYSNILTDWQALEKRLDLLERKPLFRIKKTLIEMQNQQFFQSATSLGAGILGLGLGILLSQWVGGWMPYLIAGGLFIHGWGMYKLHYSNKSSWSKLPTWLKISVGLCWLILAGLLAWLLVIFFGA